MTRTRLTLSLSALALASSLAFGQNADPNSAGPTKNDYRLRVVEPAEGATITGGTVRVVVNTSVRQSVGDQETKTDTNSMPRPLVDIFIDDKLQGTLKDENNVLSVDAVTPGAHKLVVLAKNLSGEIIDRKEIKFNTVIATADTSTTTRSTTVEERRAQSVPPPAAPAPVAPPPPAPKPQTYAPPPAPAPAPVAVAETRSTELPSTGTSDLAIAAAGLALLVGGLALRRRA